MILWAASSKFHLAMVLAVLGTTCSLGFLLGLELLGGIVLRRDSFLCAVLLEESPVSSFKFHF